MDRRDLRHSINNKRKNLTPEYVESVSVKVCENVKELDCFKQARKIASYIAVNGEINPITLENPEIEFSYPVIQKSGNLKFFHSNDRLVTGKYGIPEPADGIEEEVEKLDLVILPLVAADIAGNRVGHGAGYYDKTFDPEKLSKRPKLVGLGYEFQVFQSIQPEAWDVPLDAVVTENEVFFREIAHQRVSMGEY